MKDEIKEIISYLKNNTFIPDETKRKYKILHRDEVNKLLDYITSLQEENERLKQELLSKPDNEITLETTDGQRMTIIQSERIDMQEKLNKSLEEMYKRYDDYKTRNDKAVEYITTEQLYTNYQWGKSQYVKILKDLLNLLQGKSDE